MNNLLERLHASFFLFLVAAPDRFLKIGNYLPSILLISVAMMFGGLAAWSDARGTPIDEGSSKRRGHDQTSRPVLSALVLMVTTHAFGALLFWALSSAWYSDKLWVRRNGISLDLD